MLRSAGSGTPAPASRVTSAPLAPLSLSTNAESTVIAAETVIAPSGEVTLAASASKPVIAPELSALSGPAQSAHGGGGAPSVVWPPPPWSMWIPVASPLATKLPPTASLCSSEAAATASATESSWPQSAPTEVRSELAARSSRSDARSCPTLATEVPTNIAPSRTGPSTMSRKAVVRRARRVTHCQREPHGVRCLPARWMPRDRCAPTCSAAGHV